MALIKVNPRELSESVERTPFVVVGDDSKVGDSEFRKDFLRKKFEYRDRGFVNK